MFRICISEKRWKKENIWWKLNGIVSGGHTDRGRISNYSGDGSSSISSGCLDSNSIGVKTSVFFWTDRLRIQPNAEEVLRASRRDGGDKGLWALSHDDWLAFVQACNFVLLFLSFFLLFSSWISNLVLICFNFFSVLFFFKTFLKNHFWNLFFFFIFHLIYLIFSITEEPRNSAF